MSTFHPLELVSSGSKKYLKVGVNQGYTWNSFRKVTVAFEQKYVNICDKSNIVRQSNSF